MIYKNQARIYKDLNDKWNLLWYVDGIEYPKTVFGTSANELAQRAKGMGVKSVLGVKLDETAPWPHNAPVTVDEAIELTA